MHRRLKATVSALGDTAHTAVEIAPDVYGEPLRAENANWFLAQTLCYLRHLEGLGRVRSEIDDGTERWEAL